MKTRAFIYIILAGILWGTSGIFVHYLAPLGFSTLQMTAMRGTSAFIFMLIYCLFKDNQIFRVTKRELVFCAASGAGVYLTAAFYFAAMQMTSVSTAVVLMYTAPVMVMIYSVAFLGEKITVMKGISVFAMLAGCCLVSGIVGNADFNLLGILVGLMAGVAYSAYNIFTKVQMRANSNPVTATMYCFAFMAVFSLLGCNPVQIVQIGLANPVESILLMLGIGACTCFLPYFLYTLALKELPAGTASALGIVEPMAATIFSVVLFGEQLNIYSICGIALILGAVFMLSRSKE